MFNTCKKYLGCDFALVAGDIIYPQGFDESPGQEPSQNDLMKVNNLFEKPYQSFGLFDFWLSLGNHDWKGDVQKYINYTTKSNRWKLPFNHYSVPGLPDWLNIYALDTTRQKDFWLHNNEVDINQFYGGKSKYSGSIGIGGVKSVLCKKRGQKIIFGHHPLFNAEYEKYRDSNAQMFGGIMLPVMKDCNIKLYLAGHSHNLQHTEINYQNQIFHNVVSGSAGKVELPMNKTPSKLIGNNVKYAEPIFGFNIVVATPKTIKVYFYGYPKGRPNEFKLVHQFEIQ